MPKLTTTRQTNLIHNFSSIKLSQASIELLSTGLSFTPTTTIETAKAYFTLLQQYDQYSNSLRSQYIKTCTSQNFKPTDITPSPDSNTIQVFRKMKFLKNSTTLQPSPI